MLKSLIRWICRKYAARIMAQGDLQTAVKVWSMAIACGDTSPQTQRALGELYFRLSDYPRAIPLLESSAPHFTADSALITILAQAYQETGKPDSAEARYLDGKSLSELNRHEEARASYQRALELKPDFVEAHNNLGVVLTELNRSQEAVESYQRALALTPNFADFHFNLGYALNRLDRHEEAIASYLRALELNPDFAEAHHNLGLILGDLKRHEEALAYHQRALALKPSFAEAHSSSIFTRQHLCAWQQITPEGEALRQRITAGKSGKISPFSFLALPATEPREQYLCAQQFAEEQYRAFLSRPPLCGTGLRADRDRLRIGYLSADYHEHPVSYLLVEVIERHDRNRFEVFGYSCGPDDASPMRKRMQAAFDSFREISRMSHDAAARQILDDRIDILIDLNGYTENNRLPILALRPAPVQVSWLGYSGTLGHPRLADYLIGDPVVSPLEHADHFSETLALLPHCFQSNDRQRAIGAQPTRIAAGLPADGFVFCCFNQSYKITPTMFGLWCRLLAEVPGSVLWLLQSTGAAEHNLRREAQARGIAAERIVFAPRRPLAEHLGRLQLADLALDTYPYASHTTASDALWAGVPLVARQGETFVSRAAASIVHAAGLPELITTNSEEYYRLALELATRPAQLAQIRARLAANRMSCPLFDSERFVRDLERIFRRMWEDYRAGTRQHIVIAADEADRPREFSRPATPAASVPTAQTPGAQTPALVQTLEEALAYCQQGRLADAERLYQAVLRLDSENFDALHLLGVLRAQQGLYDEAMELIGGALRRNPDSAEAHNNLGNALYEVQRHEEAIASCQKALAIKPDFAEAHYNLGNALHALNRNAEAIASYQAALSIKPHDADAHSNLGNALCDLNRNEEAIASYQSALAIQPDLAEAHWNQSHALLVIGDYERGWEHYEWRWATRGHAPKPDFAQPQWRGTEDLSGKTILLHNEQGFGDTLQFVRYAPLVAARGARVVLQVQRPLQALVASLAGVDVIVAQGDVLPAFDCHCPLLSLPLAFATTLQSVPAEIPYLHATDDRIAKWQALLGERAGPRVGLAWSGNRIQKNDHNRSIALKRLLPLLSVPGVRFVSLQKGLRAEDAEVLKNLSGFTHIGDQLDDFADTAAVVSLLDLVISVDSAVAHLTGALGRPLWVVLPFAGGWRWLLDRDDSPWYPSARLFRQPQAGDWNSVIDRVREDLLLFPRAGFSPAHPRRMARHGGLLKSLIRWVCRRYASHVTAQGDLQTAVKAWSMAVACGDTSPQTQRALGELYFQLEDYPRAIPLLESASPHFTANNSLAAMLAQMHRQAAKPDSAEAHFIRGDTQHEAGHHAEAIASYQRAIALKPDFAEAHNNLGNALNELKRHEEALASFRSALALKPDLAVFHFNLGNTLDDLNRHEEAIASYQEAIALRPDFADAYSNLGSALNALKRHEEAIASYRKALAIQPGLAEAHNNLGSALNALKRHEEAIASCQRALALKPDLAEAHNNLGSALNALKRHEEAIASCQRALAIQPDLAEAHGNLGHALSALGRPEEAIASCQRALELKPDLAEAHINLGNAFNEIELHEEAIASYHRALALKPDLAEAHYNLGNALNECKRYEEAVASYHNALVLRPDWAEAHSSWVHVCQHLYAWSQVTPEIDALRERVRQGRSGKMSPFCFLALPATEPREQYLCAQQFAEEQYRAFLSRPPLCGTGLRADRDRLRIGYLSADYHEHATSHLLVEVIERHDRNRFEVFGYSCGPDDASPMRKRMQAAFDSFREISRMSHDAAARQILDDRIDILVDLKGYTENNRLPILALRPAPVQVSWLGYPGTLGHPRLADYLIGDPVVSPLEHADHFSETLALLPHCYQPNDRQRAIGAQPTRIAAGLPADGFVFCCFNQSYKITPTMFGLWCRLLAEVPGSVLWLLQSTGAAEHNLRREAQARGIAAERIVFAPRRPLAEHLGRLQLADLALDTYPVASHTTASDALWAGVPLVARQGETFVSRAAASIVNAAGLPELITTNSEEYYRLALELATQTGRLAKIKARLMANRLNCPLFDSARFVRDLERVFLRMWTDYRAGTRQNIVIGADEDDRPREFSRPAPASASAPTHHTQGTPTPALVQTLEEAMALHRKGNLGGAVKLYLEALTLAPGEPQVHLNLGKALMASGNLEDANTHFETALRLAPGDPQILCCAGEVQGSMGHVDQAAEYFQQAIKQAPDFVPAHVDMGILLENAKRYPEAARWLQEAVRLDAANASAWHRLGSVFLHMGEVNRGILHLQKALALAPRQPDILSSLGAAHAHIGEHSVAEDYFDRALEIAPDFTDARFNRSLIYLHRENYLTGFSEYESRLQKPETQYLSAKSRWPIWKGEPLAGKRLVLLAEQGFGDTIQFIRFAPPLVAQGAVISADVSAPLRRLIATARGVMNAVTLDQERIEADFCCPLMSLPHRLGITADNLASTVPYLHVSENDQVVWRTRLEDCKGLRLGVVWESDAENWIAKLKNISLRELWPVLAMDELSVVSLQVGGGGNQLRDLPEAIGVTDLTSELRDFYDTACLIANLDLVITIDTAVAHLAGALGKPVWILLHHAPDWRWSQSGNASRWYPGARLFRQSSPGVWTGVVSELTQAMQQWVRESVRR